MITAGGKTGSWLRRGSSLLEGEATGRAQQRGEAARQDAGLCPLLLFDLPAIQVKEFAYIRMGLFITYFIADLFCYLNNHRRLCSPHGWQPHLQVPILAVM